MQKIISKISASNSYIFMAVNSWHLYILDDNYIRNTKKNILIAVNNNILTTHKNFKIVLTIHQNNIRYHEIHSLFK